MQDKERHIYVVGKFFAKYWGDRIKATEPGRPTDYTINTYDHRITQAEYVEDPEVPPFEEVNCMQPELLKEVLIHFKVDPAGYGKPFREDLRNPLIANIKMEGVVRERKRTYGTIRGMAYVKVHTTVLPPKEK